MIDAIIERFECDNDSAAGDNIGRAPQTVGNGAVLRSTRRAIDHIAAQHNHQRSVEPLRRLEGCSNPIEKELMCRRIGDVGGWLTDNADERQTSLLQCRRDGVEIPVAPLPELDCIESRSLGAADPVGKARDFGLEQHVNARRVSHVISSF
jgi:hypothetical protein